MLLAVWILSGVHMAANLRRGWVPHDEGSFGQSAERVLQGELPHRDFDELYTGGLSLVHAAAFRLLGANLWTLRVVLFLAFLAWVPAVYAVAARFVSPLAAGVATLLSVAWSVPNYAAAVPSWYNLFFATFGVAALLRYVERPRRVWLALSGMAGGASFLAKSVGLYFIAGVLLFLLFREQSLAQREAPAGERRSRLYGALLGGGLSVMVAALALLIREHASVEEIIHYVLPAAALAALLLLREARGVRGDTQRRIARLWRMAGPFLAGVAAPVAVFLAPYVMSHSTGAWVRGVFILPSRRILGATMAAPELKYLPAAVLPVALLAGAMIDGERARRVITMTALPLLALVLWFSADHPGLYRLAWHAARELIPIAVLCSAGFLLGTSGALRGLSEEHRQGLMLLLSVTSLCSLVQFPFAAPIYFCYVAPLLILTLLALVTAFDRLPKMLLAGLAAFYLLFAAVRVTPGFIYTMGRAYAPDRQTEALTPERAGRVRVAPEEAALYRKLIPLVREHAGGGYGYATPDCPEVYFLAGLKNPTRTLFEFFDEPQGRTRRVLGALETHDVRVVVIYRTPAFSQPIAPEMEAALAGKYPSFAKVGLFEVRWRP